MPQHVIIMGGTSGIGLVTAEILLNQGFKVTVAGRNARRLADAGERLRHAAQTVAVDGADPDAAAAFFRQQGSCDHLVLAFGSTRGVGPFESVGVDDVRRGFNEKVFPHFACAQAARPFLSPNGSITFVSAVTAFAAVSGTAGIGAANAAIASLVPTLASELRPLRVNGVAPGVIDTPWWDFLSAEQKAGAFADFARKTPVGRVGTSQDIGQTIAFLITNTFMTGQTIICDGGIRLSA